MSVNSWSRVNINLSNLSLKSPLNGPLILLIVVSDVIPSSSSTISSNVPLLCFNEANIDVWTSATFSGVTSWFETASVTTSLKRPSIIKLAKSTVLQSSTVSCIVSNNSPVAFAPLNTSSAFLLNRYLTNSYSPCSGINSRPAINAYAANWSSSHESRIDVIKLFSLFAIIKFPLATIVVLSSLTSPTTLSRKLLSASLNAGICSATIVGFIPAALILAIVAFCGTVPYLWLTPICVSSPKSLNLLNPKP